MVEKEQLEDKLELISEDEFLFQIERELRKIDNKKKKYINTINKIMKYKSFNFAINYYYNKTQQTYECEFIKKGKIGFKQNG